ncbi:hypothetical protein ACL02S_08705 [Nocardia sp. 004]|uniref:hypothetical protein n=1 Tax=Nocardia sp. 004 TaxID=3385978 RepID=UPI00399FE8E2
MTDSREELREQIRFIRSHIDAIGSLPEKVDSFSGHIVKLIRVSNIPFTAEWAVDEIWDHRDKINKAIRETWRRLSEISPDLEVPIDFLDIADVWRDLKGDIQAAGQDFYETSLSSEWQGDAAARYVEMRARQEKALISLPIVSEDIAKSLEKVAASELELYVDLSIKTQELVATVTETTGSAFAAMFDLPLGAISAMGDLLNTVVALETMILGYVASMADNALECLTEGNRIKQNLSIQDGFPDNTWPSAVKGSYGQGIDGIRAAIGDASAKDGDKSDWEIGITRVVAE